MELLNQFQGFIGSIGFGFFFIMFFHFVFCMTKRFNIFLKFIIDIGVFLLFTYLYFLFLLKYTYGILNIFYPLSILIGILFYYMFYYPKFNKFYIDQLSILRKVIQLNYQRTIGIISKKIKEKRYVKTIKNKK